MVKINEFFDQEKIQDLKIGDELPYNVVEDLAIFMRHDPKFYRRQLYPEMLNVKEATKNGGKYNKRNMLPAIETAIREYIKKFNLKKRPEDLISDGEKMECISKILKDEMEMLKKGDY